MFGLDIQIIGDYIQKNGQILDIKDLIRLADLVLVEIQYHRNAGPGWKGLRTDLQEFVGDDYGEINWVCKESR